MKLSRFTHLQDYVFSLVFANGETIESNLADLIGNHVDLQNLKTARIDPEWGCLEFSSGRVDIEPKTLYRYAMDRSHAPASRLHATTNPENATMIPLI
jgi:hypothetical protein